MPYKMIIVDDEDVIRRGLAKMIDWNSLGFDVIAVLEDGDYAMKFIDEKQVDVVLSDIKMTNVSGLELAKYIFEKKPNIRVVLISGYKEFEFARQAIDYNVFKYLLKPTRIEEVKQIFRDLKFQLDMDIEQKEQMKNQLFSDISMGTLKDEDEIKRRIRLSGLDIDVYSSKCCIIDSYLPGYDCYLNESWEYGKDNFYTAICNFLRTDENDIYYIPLFILDDEIKVMAIARSNTGMDSFRLDLENHFQNVQDGMKAIFGLDLSIGSFIECENMLKAIRDGICLKTANRPRNLKGYENSCICHDGLLEQKKLFISYIDAGNFDAVSSLFKTIIKEMGQTEIKYVHEFIIDLFAKIGNKLSEVGVDIYVVTKGGFNYDTILKLKDIHDVLSWGLGILGEIVRYLERYRETIQKSSILKAKQYINENYSKDICLNDIADYVYLSPLYLSRLFKQQTGENFIDYLIRVRMEKSMELLRSSKYKVYEVGSLAGYKSIRHFSRLFKQYTGFTPAEYRQNLLGQDVTGIG
jgi:Response regulator containing CheY-like receiver domain and AraC-type DNA-binding domain